MKNIVKLFNVNGLNVEVVKYNEEYFTTAKDLVVLHSLLLQNFSNSKFDDLIEFLKDSVENNYYLNDLLEELKFKVDKDNDIIFLDEDKIEMRYESMGEYYVNNYRVVVSGSYSFIESITTKEQYLYYGE